MTIYPSEDLQGTPHHDRMCKTTSMQVPLRRDALSGYNSHLLSPVVTHKDNSYRTVAGVFRRTTSSKPLRKLSVALSVPPRLWI